MNTDLRRIVIRVLQFVFVSRWLARWWHRRRCGAGIGAYRIPSESTVEKINVARGLNAEGFILFSYDFTAPLFNFSHG
jgi:hypothetical protein